MRKCVLVLCAALALTWGASTASADTIDLNQFAFNVNGTVFVDSFPAFANAAGFDTTTGLGTFTFDFRPGPGTYDILAYFDHDITGLTNPFDDEFAATSGTPATGQSWEMDEPGNNVGDLVANFLFNTLDNKILDGTTNGPQDIAMAMGFHFTIPDATKRALFTFNLSTTAPNGGFYLHQIDRAGGDIFFSANSLVGEIPTDVPEPASLLLLGTGLVTGLRKLRRR